MNRPMGRRAFLHASAGAAGTALAAGAAGAQEGGVDYGGWFDGVSNFEGTVDRTDQSEVTVAVGAPGNQGNFAFDPAAVRVSPGTTVRWEWTGEGGGHNVVAESGAGLDSGALVSEAGVNYEFTFEEPGVTTYFCEPHRSLGMKGAVVVGQVGDQAGGGEGSGGEGSGGEGSLVLTPPLAALGAVIVLGLLSPMAFAVLLYLRDGGRPAAEDTE